MSVDRLPSGKWRARYRDSEGSQHSKSFDREKEAKAWRVQQLVARN